MKDGRMLTKSVALILKAMEVILTNEKPSDELIKEITKMQIIADDRAEEIK